VSIVLDASALLALLATEPGTDRVAAALADGAIISAVNVSEVVAKLSDWHMPEAEIREVIDGLRLDVIAFDLDLALHAGSMRGPTRSLGLSLGDRACLALAQREGATALTTDRTWSGLEAIVAIGHLR
jgi:ribonuclease VapC